MAAPRAWATSGEYCAAPNCSNNRKNNPDLVFHRFPKDDERCKRWVINSRREDLLKKESELLSKNCVLCREHFEDSQYLNAKADKLRLIHCAVPTIFAIPNPPPAIGCKRKLPQRAAPATTTKRKEEAAKEAEVPPPTALTRSPRTTQTGNQDRLKGLQKKNHSLRMQVCRLKQKLRASQLAHDKTKLALRKYGLINKKSLLPTQLNNLRKCIQSIAITASKVQLDFIMVQIQKLTKKARGRRWDAKDRALALSLLHSSPRTYRLLRSIFALPSISSLKSTMKKIQIYPGFNQNILKALKEKTSSGPPASRLVTLAIDEMTIKEGLSYDAGRDVIEGFTDGVEKKNELANHANVFMIRGIMKKWKQPLGYFLSSGPMSGDTMSQLLTQCIRELRNIGIRVVVVVCDQGSNNRNMFDKILKVSSEKPYFMCEEDKVFVMYDPPHLIKSIRNNLKNHGFMDGEKEILWTHIQEFFEKDSSKPIRLAPRLTKKHLDLPPFAPLRVYLATQVLSHSVAQGMATLTQWDLLPAEAAHTAEFIEKMDQLFNTFNSQSMTSGAHMRHALTAKSGHQEFLEDILTWIRTIKTKGKRPPACLSGWELSINSLLQIWNYLHSEYEVQFLLTNRLNQDCVENLFSVIRGKGGQRDNPDSAQFRAAFRQVMVDFILLPIHNSNCEEDVDTFLFSLTGMEGRSTSDSEVPPTIVPPQETALESLPDCIRSLLSSLPDVPFLSLTEDNILAYIAGYMAKKISHKVCNVCKLKLIGTYDPENPEQIFIANKNYEGAKEGLTFASNLFVALLRNVETEFRNVIEEAVIGEKVKASLVNTLGKRVDFIGFECNVCPLSSILLHLFVNVRLHFVLQDHNRKLVENKDRKNRKTFKFSYL